MDDSIGICPECGGRLYYVESTNEIICDCCDYTVEEAE